MKYLLHPGSTPSWSTAAGERVEFRLGLRLFRKAVLRLTQRAFALRIGYNVNHYTGIETGSKRVTPRLQAAILAAYQPVAITADLEFVTDSGIRVPTVIGVQALCQQEGWDRPALAGTLRVSLHVVNQWIANDNVPEIALVALRFYCQAKATC